VNLAARPGPLRVIVLAGTGQDVRRCTHCSFCSELLVADQDVSLETMMQLVVMNDESVLTTRTLWSDAVLERARHVCTSTVDVPAVLQALRAEARRRGLVD
jgi:heterodisulfide reductase subunit C